MQTVFSRNSTFVKVVLGAIVIGVVVLSAMYAGVMSKSAERGFLALGVVVWLLIIGYGVKAHISHGQSPKEHVQPGLEHRDWLRSFDRRAL